MDLSGYKDFVATAASLFTLIQFLSGMMVCYKFMKVGTSDDVSMIPFLSGFLSNTVWSRYGHLIGDKAIVIVNSAGTLLMMVYSTLHYLYTTRKKAGFRKIVVITVLVTLVQIFASVEEDAESARSLLGALGSVMSLAFVASPLTSLGQVVRTRSTECLPFPMILTGFIVSSLWALYGFIINDTFLIYPNWAGSLLTAFQLSLFCVYPSLKRNYEPSLL